MKRILVVDDNEFVLRMLASVIASHFIGSIVRTAANGNEALAVLSAETADLVVTDLNMPVMNGYELIERLSRTDPQLPVIAVSGDCGKRETAARLDSLRVTRCIQKPFLLPELLGTLESALADIRPARPASLGLPGDAPNPDESGSSLADGMHTSRAENDRESTLPPPPSPRKSY